MARMRDLLEAFFDQPDMPEQIAASGRPALIAKACIALADMVDAAGISPVLKGKFLNQMTRVLSPEGCATMSRTVDLASTRLVLEATDVLPSDTWFALLPQVITREACATAADADESRTMGEMAARVGAFPRELQEERMPFLITQQAIETVGMGNDAPPKSVWAAAISTNLLPPEARAEAVENILSNPELRWPGAMWRRASHNRTAGEACRSSTAASWRAGAAYIDRASSKHNLLNLGISRP